jgi:sigma-B regulation protein RsbU (phosphoserine phosphatase)
MSSADPAAGVGRAQEIEPPSDEERERQPGEAEAAHERLRHMRHQLRTPLNHIIGYSEMLLDDVGDRRQDRLGSDLRKMRDGGRRLVALVDDLLDSSKLDAQPMVDFPAFGAAVRQQLRQPVDAIVRRSESLLEDAQVQRRQEFLTELHRIHSAAIALLALTDELHLQPAEDLAAASAVLPVPRARATQQTSLPAHERKAAGEESRGHLLVVDDDEMNRDVLCRRLTREGYDVAMAENGRQALDMIAAQEMDLVLLDIMMPDMNGYEVLERLKADSTLFQLPVIMISARDEIDSVARCIEIGAEDYLPKPFNPVLLKARVGACLEKKRLRDRERSCYQAMVRSQKQLAAELAQAAAYVTSLLPLELAGPVETAWRFVPSTQLGGDAFGYHWLDADHFAIYLLDVCGHGVGAALLSISVMNLLRSSNLPDTDLRSPSEVLSALNEAFPMEEHNNMYFTIWYGVYDRPGRRIAYASGGHPPAVLLTGPDADTAAVLSLGTGGMVIGAVPGVRYPTASQDIGAFNKLYVFSDGAYEITREDGRMLTMAEFVRLLALPSTPDASDLDRTLADLERIRVSDSWEDDLSIVRVAFGS